MDRVAFAVACEVLSLDKLCDQDYVFLTEFASVIKPIADSITYLEGSVKTFGGYLPMLFSCSATLKDLSVANTLKYCEPLLTAVRMGFAKRFNSIMRLGNIFERADARAVPLFLAMLTNPGFKLAFIPDTWFYENANGIHQIKSILMNAMKQWMNNENPVESTSNTANSNENPAKGILLNRIHAKNNFSA